VLTFRITGSFGEDRDYTRIVQRINRTLDELTALPQIDAAATTLALPGLPGGFTSEVDVVELGDDGKARSAEVRVVSPSYFDTMQIPIVEGELCRRPEDARGVTEVMVNRAFAGRYIRGRAAVGLHLAAASPDRIAGVVGDAREIGIDRNPVPTVYQCFSAGTPIPWFLARSAARRGVPIEDIRRTLRNIDPQRSVYDVMPLDERIGGVYAPTRVRTILLALFAITALLLACLGVYGALSYVVSLRQREAGLRLALGASRLGIIRQFCGHALRVIGAACVCGLLLSAAFTRALSGMLFGVSPLDPLTLSGVVALVLAVASIAALLPSARAAFAEPAQVLRGE
jgi:putative ABC transport system permease protein